MPARRPNVFTIPSGAPFLPTLADAVLAGRLGTVPGLGVEPLAMADVTILLPTRRAVRTLREVFLRKLGGAAAILPVIRPIGDVDEEEHLLRPPTESAGDRLMLPPAIPRLERLLVLTELVLAWARAMRGAALGLKPDEPILIATGAADAARLAGDLARLMDEMTAAGIAWSGLAGLVPDDYPKFWQITLDFLKIATELWPAHLAEKWLADPAARRDELIRLEAARIREGDRRLVIAAGSTGSVPATAELLASIAASERGAVVLPGLDQGLDAGGWAAIGGTQEGAPGHPQFGLKQLLESLRLDRGEVPALAQPSAALAGRSRLVSEAMRPAETTDAWAVAAKAGEADLAGVSLLVGRNEQEEALAIAMALRESAERPGAVAALVTPDRTLARRVAVELKRWKIEVDDSAGVPLSATSPAVFARLIVEAAAAEADPVALLALLKHPLAAFGLKPELCRRAARHLEIALLRGPRVGGGLAGLAAGAGEVRLAIEFKRTRFVPQARRRLTPGDWNAAEDLLRRVVAILGPLEAAARGSVTVADAGQLLVAAMKAAGDPDPERGLWSGQAGEALAALLAGLVGPEAARLTMPLRDFPGFLAAAMGAVAIAPPLGADPRIHIWGTLEARLQSADLVILGGLDEAVWPVETRTDPWLSRPMRAALGLPAPERRIGLSAHDFAEAMAAERVIVTRAEKRGGAPTVPSRWLQRLLALAGPAAGRAMIQRGATWVRLARQIDTVPRDKVAPIRRPEPRPPLAVRPRSLSISDIETWIRDPYALYAKRILKLEALDAPGEPPDPATRGSLFHDVLAAFTSRGATTFGAEAERELLAIWRKEMERVAAFPEIHAIWWLRAQPIMRWFLAWEARRQPEVAARHPEIDGKIVLETPGGSFLLRARADRIDLRHDGGVDIFDYKSGQHPKPAQVVPFSPQLALEAAMAVRGGFGDQFKDREVKTLAWIALARAGSADDPVATACLPEFTPGALGEAVIARLLQLIAAYDRAETPYRSHARPPPGPRKRYPGDYDHLARVDEWRTAGGGDDA